MSVSKRKLKGSQIAMDEKFAVLFEPVRIGPVVAPNRFFQVPHCNGMGYRMPRAHAAMRGMKAEGGWGVVCTEETEIHHSSDVMPYIEGRIWGEEDIPYLALMVDSVHQHGALAGIELTFSGHHGSNIYSRATSLGVTARAVSGYMPWQTRQVDKEDIRNIRRWHRQAALRAKKAGFDIIYCYAAHDLSMAMHFMQRRNNDRTDEYGGSVENRVRFFRELIEDTKETVGDTCAVAARLAVDELLGEEGITHQGEGYEIVSLLAELPDLWDVNISDWDNDSGTSRFDKEGFQEKYISFVKSLTSRPVVGVGRYTSPDAMASAIRRGVMDLIGTARPSIADPFLPEKVREGRVEDIRECIGCNICVTGDTLMVPLRCTQNPTMGEEWRRGWHPEKLPSRKSEKEVAVIGAGPAGLECARALGQRGYPVTLLEANREPGGRVIREAELPGLSEWRRVVDWRITQIEKMAHVAVFPGSLMSAGDVLEAGFRNVIVATGATWRRDGVGRTVRFPLPGSELGHIYTPDDLMSGRLPKGDVVVYDDDHYYMGSLMAELLARQGCRVSLMTAAPSISYWTEFTLEQGRILKRLHALGVKFYTQHIIDEIHADHVRASDEITGGSSLLPCNAVVLVSDRNPNNELYLELKPAMDYGQIDSLRLIGDAEAPHIIAQAIWSGHNAAREFDEKVDIDITPFKREHSL